VFKIEDNLKALTGVDRGTSTPEKIVDLLTWQIRKKVKYIEL